MNEKAAKRLRKDIRTHPDADKIPSETVYQQRVVKRRRFQVGVDKDGKAVYVEVDMRQIRLGNCKRAIYQRVKKAVR